MRSAAKLPKASRVADLIGDTPLLPLDRLTAHVSRGVRLYAKAEWHNPGGSVKDRAALGMVRAAERAGLTKDEILLDATSGNTGIALAMLGAAEGYRVTLCVPANLSTERKRILKAYGAELVFTPATEGTARSDVPRRSRPPTRASTGISTSTTTKRTGGPISRRQGRRFGNRPAGRSPTSWPASARQGPLSA